MTREQELLQVANNYSQKLSGVTTHPPVDKRYSKSSKDRIAISMRHYYYEVSTILSSDRGENK
jgi:hypothetical protein